MEKIKIILKGEFTSLNEYISADRNNRYAGASVKKNETERAYYEIKKKKLEKIKCPIYIDFLWVTKNLKKDADNVSFSKKFILDAMVQAKLIENDTRKYVLGFKDDFAVDPTNPRVELTIWA